MLTIAIRAARSAGGLFHRAIDTVGTLPTSQKVRNDFANEVERRVEETIIQAIRKAYPQHAILTDESRWPQGNEYGWIIGPLSGTANFLHGLPHFALSIALTYRGKIELAVIHNPLQDELFSAARGEGTTLNNRRLRVSNQTDLNGALIGGGSLSTGEQTIESELQINRALVDAGSGVRLSGSTTLDLAYVAAGRLDGSYAAGLNQREITAGFLLIQEAGGVVSDFNDGDNFFRNGQLVAGNPKVQQHILAMVKSSGLPIRSQSG